MATDLQNSIKELIEMGQAAKKASVVLRGLSSQDKNQALCLMADAIEEFEGNILQANQKDIESGRENGLTEALIERLTLSSDRVKGMADGLREIARLSDPLANTISEWVSDDGLIISQKRVPLGVIGIIYESRPNVTADASGLCLKAGNAVILRGGREAFNSNQAIITAIKKGLSQSQAPETAVNLITDPSRELASEFMQMDEYLDCLIPRGGAGLIQSVKKQATVPVIETGIGICHTYLHSAADPEKAKRIAINAKVQRPSVCNAMETLVVDEEFAEKHLKDILSALEKEGVEIRGDEKTRQLYPNAGVATEEDYAAEYSDLILAVKVVSGYDEAIAHIQQYSSGHSDAIVSQDYSVVQNFLNDIDSATVYANASTRFTDGGVFGLGGEIGISTQKLHARGPMGLTALTSYKYTVQGDGQIRE